MLEGQASIVTLRLITDGCAPSSCDRFVRICSLKGLNLGFCAIMVASRLPSWYPLSSISRTCSINRVMPAKRAEESVQHAGHLSRPGHTQCNPAQPELVYAIMWHVMNPKVVLCGPWPICAEASDWSLACPNHDSIQKCLMQACACHNMARAPEIIERCILHNWDWPRCRQDR